MSDGVKTILYPVEDLATTKALFTKLLGVEPFVDQPEYVAFMVGGQQIGLDPSGHSKGMTGPVPYLHVDDIKASRQAILDAGGEALGDINDVGGDKLWASVKDLNGNVIGLIQPGRANQKAAL